MIERVRVLGYRKFRELNFEPHQRLNILVGDNDAGKSTLLEAITLALTGRVSGRRQTAPQRDQFNRHCIVKCKQKAASARRVATKYSATPCDSHQLTGSGACTASHRFLGELHA